MFLWGAHLIFILLLTHNTNLHMCGVNMFFVRNTFTALIFILLLHKTQTYASAKIYFVAQNTNLTCVKIYFVVSQTYTCVKIHFCCCTEHKLTHVQRFILLLLKLTHTQRFIFFIAQNLLMCDDLFCCYTN